MVKIWQGLLKLSVPQGEKRRLARPAVTPSGARALAFVQCTLKLALPSGRLSS
jgi:hypothetical protein